jgi:hypothetical protein
MTWTLCTSGAAIYEAGLYANSTLVSYAGDAKTNLDFWSDEAESFLSSVARVDLVTNYANFTAEGKAIMQDACASYVAQKIVKYDMSGYTDRREAMMILNILENNLGKAVKLLSEDKVKTYLAVTT